LVVLPPSSGPAPVPAVDSAAVSVPEEVAHELIDRTEIQFRLLILRVLSTTSALTGGWLVRTPIGHTLSSPPAAATALVPASIPLTALAASSSVCAASGSCARMEALIASAESPAIHGTVRISVGRAPDAITAARPLGSAPNSDMSRMRSRLSCFDTVRWPRPYETELESRS